MLTSGMPESGVTSITLNIAMACAATDERILVIDDDEKLFELLKEYLEVFDFDLTHALDVAAHVAAAGRLQLPPQLGHGQLVATAHVDPAEEGDPGGHGDAPGGGPAL